jgi:hypothetical protein
MSERPVKIAALALALVLGACVAWWPEARPLGPVRAEEAKDAGGRRPAKPQFPFDVAPAFHYRSVVYRSAPVDVWNADGIAPATDVLIHEVWAVQGDGRREENSEGSRLVSVTVDTPRSRFSWDAEQNLLVVSRGDPEGVQVGKPEYCNVTMGAETDRERAFRFAESVTGIAVSQKEQRDGKEVEKIIAYYPPCFHLGSSYSAHGFDPKWYLRQSGTEFRTRQYWFDPTTGRFLGRRCGCKWPQHDLWIDYPPPESVPKELFTFQVPAGAKVEVTDPELRRQFQSEGRTGPAPRQ